MVSGETYIFSTEDRHLPHEAGLACLFYTIFVLVVIQLFQRGSRVCANKNKQQGAHTKTDNGWILNLKTERGDHIRGRKRGGGRESKKKRKKNREMNCFLTGFQNQDRPIYFSSPKIIFITPLCILIFKKAFKKQKQKNIERLKFLGRKPNPKGGQIPHCTQLVQHLFVNHRWWSVAWWEDHPSKNVIVVPVRLSGVTIKLVQGCYVCFQPSHFLFLQIGRAHV